MLTRQIPSWGEQLPVIGLGTWQTFDHPLSDAPTVERLAETLRGLRSGEGTVVDTSPMYGRSETTLGAVAERAGLLGELFVATKVWTSGEQSGAEQMRQSMTLLRR